MNEALWLLCPPKAKGLSFEPTDAKGLMSLIDRYPVGSLLKHRKTGHPVFAIVISHEYFGNVCKIKLKLTNPPDHRPLFYIAWSDEITYTWDLVSKGKKS
tara:strand:+ start:177 stop:476 length:300 start_codon:yes stop_codon:yes gene_type:complete